MLQSKYYLYSVIYSFFQPAIAVMVITATRVC